MIDEISGDGRVTQSAPPAPPPTEGQLAQPMEASVSLVVAPRNGGSGESAAPVSQEPGERSLQLLTRFLAGAAVIGAEELFARLAAWDDRASPASEAARDGPPPDASTLDLARYLFIGACAWGGRQALHALNAAVATAPAQRSALLKSIDAFTGIWPFGQLRAPLRKAVADLSVATARRVVEGWREEQAGRQLAKQAIDEALDDLIDRISENPELAALVRDQITRQSTGLATTVRDTSREWSETADDLVESFARRLFRRSKRKNLPAGARLNDGSGADGRG